MRQDLNFLLLHFYPFSLKIMERPVKDINALTKIYDLLLWMIPTIEKFPKSQRFLLGDRIESILLDILELVIQAVYTKNKTGFLRDANLKLEKLRYAHKACEGS